MAPKPQLTVLNVSGDKESLYFSSRVLREAGFRVLQASSVEEAATLARQHPDLIVIDARIESGKRCEICRSVGNAGFPLSIPVLHLVSEIKDMVAEDDCPLGMRQGNLRWPASADTLLATIRELIQFPVPTPTRGSAADDLVSRLTLAASYQVDPDGIVLAWSAAAERQFGYSEAEVLGRFLPIVDEAHRGEFLSMIASTALYRWETLRRAKDGRILSMAISMLPISDWRGKVRRVQIFAADISEVKRLHLLFTRACP